MCTSSTGGGSDCGGEKLLLLCSVANFVFVSLATFVGAVLHEVVEDDANEFVSFLKRGIIIVVDIFFTMHLNS